MGVDLHTHTTASDGSDSPAELVVAAAAMGLSAVAVTDHDTTEGLTEAENAAAPCRDRTGKGIGAFPGVESGGYAFADLADRRFRFSLLSAGSSARRQSPAQLGSSGASPFPKAWR